MADAKRSGRRPKFTAVQVALVKALACTPPQDNGWPLSRWSCPDLAQQAIADGICDTISPTTLRRWLSEDALKDRLRDIRRARQDAVETATLAAPYIHAKLASVESKVKAGLKVSVRQFGAKPREVADPEVSGHSPAPDGAEQAGEVSGHSTGAPDA